MKSKHIKLLGCCILGVVLFAAGIILRPAVVFYKNKLLFNLNEDRQTHPDYFYSARRRSNISAIGSNRPVVFLGDSRIEEADWSELLGRSDVSNRGISGDTVGAVLRRLDEAIPTAARVCVLQAGFNDVYQGEPVERVVERLKELIVRVQSEKKANVVVTSVILSGQTYRHMNDNLRSLNESLQAFCDESGLVWINLNDLFCPNGFLAKEFTIDDIHLNGKAYRMMAESLKSHLN